MEKDTLKTEEKNVDTSPINDDYNPDRKDKNIIIRVSEKERNELHKLARKSGYKSTSKYLIDCAKDPVIFMDNLTPFYEYLSEVSRIGTNVNQVVKHVNYYGQVQPNDVRELQSEIAKMKSILNTIYEQYSSEKKLLKRQYNTRNMSEDWAYGNDKNSPN